MKLTFKNIALIALAVLAIVLWWTRPAEPDYSEYIKIGGKEYKLLESKVDTIIKDTTIYKEKRVPVPEYVQVPVEVEVPADVDTTAILTDYYRKRFYNDTIVNIDGEGSTAIIKDTISQNRIVSREAQFDIKNKVIKETITVLEPPRIKAFIGVGATAGTEGVGGNAAILLKDKKDNIFGLRGGVMNIPVTGELTPYIGAEYYIKLSFRKKNKR